MKVTNDNRLHAVADVKPAKAPASVEKTQLVAPKDKVSVSEEARSLNEHASRIAELKAMVARGDNIVHPDRIAKAMVSDALAGAV